MPLWRPVFSTSCPRSGSLGAQVQTRHPAVLVLASSPVTARPARMHAAENHTSKLQVGDTITSRTALASVPASLVVQIGSIKCATASSWPRYLWSLGSLGFGWSVERGRTTARHCFQRPSSPLSKWHHVATNGAMQQVVLLTKPLLVLLYQLSRRERR